MNLSDGKSSLRPLEKTKNNDGVYKFKKKHFPLSFWGNVLWATPTRKRLTGNFFSLSVLQAANYLLPLLSLPYLVRVLGPSNFGLIAFAQAFINYFVIFTDYGFNLSATREISIERENKDKVAEIFSSVMIIKGFFCLFSLIVLLLLLFFIPRFHNDWIIYIYAFGTVVGNAMFPVWFFQGIEKMKYTTFINVASKLFFTICVFIFIRNINDYTLVPLISSMGYLIAGIISMVVVFRNFGVKFKFSSVDTLKCQLKSSWYFFISNISISLVSGSNAFLLGLFVPNLFVGYYSAAEKLVKGSLCFVSPISGTLFPFISQLAKKSKKESLKLLKKILRFNMALGGVISLALFVFSPFIVNFVFGSEFTESVIVLRILSAIVFLLITNDIAGMQTMIPFGYEKAFSNIILMGSIVNILLLIILSPIFYHIGAAISWLASEIVITVSMFVFLKKRGIDYLSFNFNKKYENGF